MLLQFVKKIWLWFFLAAFLLTSVISISHIYEARSLVSELYDLRERERELSQEGTQLSLEQSLLTRSSRLQQYARTRLNLHKPQDIRGVGDGE